MVVYDELFYKLSGKNDFIVKAKKKYILKGLLNCLQNVIKWDHNIWETIIYVIVKDVKDNNAFISGKSWMTIIHI